MDFELINERWWIKRDVCAMCKNREHHKCECGCKIGLWKQSQCECKNKETVKKLIAEIDSLDKSSTVRDCRCDVGRLGHASWICREFNIMQEIGKLYAPFKEAFQFD